MNQALILPENKDLNPDADKSGTTVPALSLIHI